MPRPETYVLTNSSRRDKKYSVTLPDGKRIHFGANGYSDFTVHRDEDRRERYIARHKPNERQYWTHTKKNLRTPSYWSRYLLWEEPTLREAKRFIEEMQGIRIVRQRL